MNRRSLLAKAAAITSLGLGGCLSDSDDATPTPTTTPPPVTPTPPPTPTPTATPTPDDPTQHTMGEAFVMETEGRRMEYTVTDAYTMHNIGPRNDRMGSELGFLVVELQYANVGSEAITWTRPQFLLRSIGTGRTYQYHVEAHVRGRQDDRIDGAPVRNRDVSPGEGGQASLIFEVRSGQYELQFRPAETYPEAETHTVTLGGFRHTPTPAPWER